MQLTVRDVAKLFSVSESTIYHWIEEDELPAFHLNDQYRFNRTELLEWANSRQIPVPDLFHQLSAAANTAGITDALKAGGIFYGIGGGNKEEALRSVVQVLPLPQEVDRSHLFNVLWARENLASTGIGDGIAIPHVRNPIIVPVNHPLITLCFLEKPIDFGSLDGRPVYVLFTLISPTIRVHLQLLSRLSFSLREPEFRSELERRAAADKILQAALHAESRFKDSSAQ
jgi:PTS system nitrogen regulatory IIA component